MMLVVRTSPLTGQRNEMVLNITAAQIDELDMPNRRCIQDIFPNLTSSQREFVKTGYTQEDWDNMFGADE